MSTTLTRLRASQPEGEYFETLFWLREQPKQREIENRKEETKSHHCIIINCMLSITLTAKPFKISKRVKSYGKKISWQFLSARV